MDVEPIFEPWYNITKEGGIGMEYGIIEKKAKEFCKKHNINSAPVEIIKICNDLGIKVFETYLKSDVSGLIIVDDKPWERYENAQKFILINLMENPARRRFTIAHELAHYVLHRDEGKLYAHRDTVQGGSRIDRVESEANFFAANVLMPEDIMRFAVREIEGRSLYKMPGLMLVKEIADIFLVSEAAAEVRLKQLKLF